MTRPLRIGAIGCGDIAERRHFPDLQALAGEAELVAIQGRSPERVAACAARFGVARWHVEADAVIADPDIDAVLVLTPPDSHLDHTERAIRAGKHVLIEKPLVGSAAEARALLDCAEGQARTRPVTVFPLPHVETAELALVRRLLAAGAIGTVTGVEAYRGHRGPSHAGWFYERARAGGGVLIDLGIYQLTTIAALFGPARRMTAACTRFFPERVLDDGSTIRPDVEDSALLTLSLAGGLAAAVTVSWNGCVSHRETRARMTVTGREGMLHFGMADRAAYVFRPDGDYRMLPEPGSDAVFDLSPCRRLAPVAAAPRSIVGDFLGRIRAGDTATRALAVQAHVLEIVERAYATEDRGSVLNSSF